MLNFASKNRTALLFAAITITAYGLLLPFTGFYWDDWPFAWIAKFLGPSEFNPAFAPFRPFLGPIFYFTTSLVPSVPLYWQVFALVIRFLIGFTAFWTFQQIWPNHQRISVTAALLILVFPGYSQHWVALTHINQELIPFIFYLLSFGFTFKALRSEKPTAYIVIALLLQICGIFPTEYFFGLEGLRFLFLFFFFDGKLFERFLKTLKIWWPYLLVWFLNAVWLIYYYKFGPYDSYEVNATQSFTVLMFLKEALDAIWKAGFYAWIQILVLIFSTLPAPASFLTLGLSALSLTLLVPYLLHSTQTDDTHENTLPISLIIIGAIGILLGRLPSLAASLPLTLQSSFDRFMVSMMIGGSVFVIGLVEFVVRNHRARIIVFAALISLGIGQQFFNANIFRRDWQKQGEIYWQMAWRMPALEPNTVLLTYQMPIDYETDLSFTAPINWMYAPEYTRSNLPYIFLYTEKRLGGGTLPSLNADTPIIYPYRTVNFSSSTSNAVVIYMPQNGCLRVLDPARGDMKIYAKLPAELTKAIPLSDPSRIIFKPEPPARPMFFPEPEHGWCYYFARAALAQQQGDYEQAVLLGNKAASAGLKPEDLNEWLTFIEAYARTGDLQTAENLSTAVLAEDEKMSRGVCIVWEQIQANGQVGSKDQIEDMLDRLGCNP